jgi:cyclic-di-AMP phosphodiesterase PgpH
MPGPPARGYRLAAVQFGLAAAVSLFLAIVASPGLSRRIPHYALGQYTTASIRAPYDFTVLDEAATARKRDEAARDALPVVTIDRRAAAAVVQRVVTAFAPVATLFAEADAQRVPGDDELRKLSARQQVVLKRRRASEADRGLAKAVADALPGVETTLGVTFSPADRAALDRARFGEPVVQALSRLAADLYAQPIVADRARFQRLVDGDAGRPGNPTQVLIRDAATGAEATTVDVSAFRSLAEAVAWLPERAVSVLPEQAPDLREVVVRLLRATATPNASYDPVATRARREAASRAVLPISLTFRRNQLIVGEGQQVTPQTVLALQYLQSRRLPSAFGWRLAGSGVMFFLLLLSGMRVAGRAVEGRGLAARDLTFVASGVAVTVGLFWVWLLVADRAVVGSPGVPALAMALLFPVAATSMLVRFVTTLEAAVLCLVVCATSVGLLAESGVGMSAYVLIVSLVGAQAVAGCNSRACLMRAGVRVAVAAGLGALALSLMLGRDATSVAITVATSTVGGLISGLLVVALAPAVEALFGYTTRISLIELVSYEQPLLKRLMVEAPGTFQHSVSIGILADAAAAAIGADRLLVRVGALYHDVGKLGNRLLFVENQSAVNPHDALSPRESARLIRAHVLDGVRMVRDQGLGERIVDFVLEHHGTRCIEYFLERARRGGGPVDVSDYRYPGPRPRSKETAILMIADQVEAIGRTMSGAGADAYRDMVETTIDRLRGEGQFDEAPVTLRDLNQIRQALARVLEGMHHHRVAYPSQPSDPAPR